MKAFRLFPLFLLIITTVIQVRSQDSGYHLIDSLVLGGDGGWDYLIVDTSAERLYVSRGTRVQVVDLAKRAIAGEIPNTNGVHGIAFAPSKGLGYTSNGRDTSVTVFDLKTLTIVKTIKGTGTNPDAIMFEPVSKRIFTFNGRSSSATAIDIESNTIAGTVPLSGKPEFAVADGLGNIFVNIEDKSSLTKFDARTLKVIDTWPLAPGEEPSGLAIDRKHHRLFSGCSNKLMAVVDENSGKVVTTVQIGDGVDATAFDPKSQLAFSSNGEGTLTVVREESPDKYSVVANVPTRRGARTMALDEKTHLIYTLTGRFGPPPPATAERPHPRPSLEPGSVTLYILGQ